jgi:hypothetical protein
MDYPTRQTQALSVAELVIASSCTHASRAMNVDDRLDILDRSIQNCLQSASRREFPFYDRPEAVAPCRKTKTLLHQFGQEANHNRNLACSSRIAALDFDLWMIQFSGGMRMHEKTDEDMTQMERNCVNMDSK